MRLFALLLILAPISPLASPGRTMAQDARWKEIVVLRSTRADVERIMGKAEEHALIVYYPLKEGSLQIEYSDGVCKTGQYRAWSVPEGTVIEVVYNPFKNPPSFSSLKLDLTKFRIVRESPDVPDLLTHIQDDKGIAYTIEPDGELHDIRYFPPSRYDHLRCSKVGK